LLGLTALIEHVISGTSGRAVRQTARKMRAVTGALRAITAFAPVFIIGTGVANAQSYDSYNRFSFGPSLFVQSAGYLAQGASQDALKGVQQQIWAIEDRLQRHPHHGSPHFAFAEETAAPKDPVIESAFASLAYSDPPPESPGPVPVKAPAPAAEPSRVTYSAWSQGFVDYENRTGSYLGIDIGRNTLVEGGIAAADVTVLQITSSADAAVFGILGGDAAASIRNADGSNATLHGPSVGAYSAYVNGGFSMDGTFKTDFFNISVTSGPVVIPLGLNNYVGIGNINYKQDMGTWWYQPTAGVNYTYTAWNAASKAFGEIDGKDFRVQAGVRFGSGFDWAGIHFKDTLTLLGYDDVLISGGTVAVATGVPVAPTDEGKIFGQAIGRLEAELTKNWTASVEGEFRGRAEVYGVAGRLGLTYIFD
jgi:hypothetical protein